VIYPWQEVAWESLRGFVAAPNHHAILFYGPAGIGKWAFVRELAAARLCTARIPSGHACGQCTSCKLIAAHTHPDLLFLVPDALRVGAGLPERELSGDKKPSKEIQVDDVREIVDQCTQTSHLGGARVVLVSPAEAMNTISANTLLKTLEEPPSVMGTTLFILVCESPTALLPTIRSRCRALAAPKPTLAQAKAYLAASAPKEAALHEAVLALHGARPLLAEQSGGALAAIGFVQAVAQSQWAQALKFDAKSFGNIVAVHGLMAWLTDVWSLKKGAAPSLCFPSVERESRQWATRLSEVQLREISTALTDAARVADHPVNSALFIEALLVRLQAT
jgi:DNA polymerase III subunit delta'